MAIRNIKDTMASKTNPWTIFTIVLFMATICQAYHLLDNGVTGYPDIVCGSDSVQLIVKTKNPFTGKLYVKGDYGNPECSRSYASPAVRVSAINPVSMKNEGTRNGIECPPCPPCLSQGAYGSPTAQVIHSLDDTVPQSMAQMTVRLGTCHMKRQRTLNPPGVAMSFTAVVNFHEHFVTKIDRAYQIRCFYMEADKTVTSILSVSLPATTELRAQAPMPTCEYTIRRGSRDGPLVRFAKINEKVYHRWKCNSEFEDLFGMLVHTCYVDDGRDQRVMVIDEKGCSVDEFLIGDIIYENSLTAFVPANVFKFADKTALDFQCAVSVCLRPNGGCKDITPPTCDKRPKRNVRIERFNDSQSSPPLRLREMDTNSQQIQVIDIDDDDLSDDIDMLEEMIKPSGGKDAGRFTSVVSSKRATEPFCLSIPVFGALVSLCTLMLTTSAMILALLYLLQNQSITFPKSSWIP